MPESRSELLAANEELRTRLGAEAEQITAQAEVIAARVGEIAGLKSKLAELERLLGRNSKSSSMPPSSDSIKD